MCSFFYLQVFTVLPISVQFGQSIDVSIEHSKIFDVTLCRNDRVCKWPTPLQTSHCVKHFLWGLVADIILRLHICYCVSQRATARGLPLPLQVGQITSPVPAQRGQSLSSTLFSAKLGLLFMMHLGHIIIHHILCRLS